MRVFRLAIGLSWMALGMVNCAGLQHQGSDPAQPDLPGFYDLQLKDLAGRSLDFSRYRGRFLVLDLFLTWAQPSQIGIPLYIELYQELHPCGLEMVGVSFDELGEKIVRPFVRGMGIPFSVAVASKEMREGRSPLGEVRSLPLLLVIDPQGRVLALFTGQVPVPKLKLMLKSYLKCPQ